MAAEKVVIPDIVRKVDGFWIPRCPPHYLQAMGPYDSMAEALDDQVGVENTINSPAWRSMMMDEEECHEVTVQKAVVGHTPGRFGPVQGRK